MLINKETIDWCILYEPKPTRGSWSVGRLRGREKPVRNHTLAAKRVGFYGCTVE
jgi:hypothetical protein